MGQSSSAGADGHRWFGAIVVAVCATALVVMPAPAAAQIDMGSVSGLVVDSRGNPLVGINVFVNTYDGAGPSTGAQTDADGAYHTDPLPDGDYRVQFDDPTDAFANQYWNGHAGWNDADRLQLAGTNRDGINATLAQAATITGTVTDDANTPLADVCVNANTPASNGGWSGVGGTTTGTDGTYTLTGLPPSIELRIQFHDCATTPSHVDQWWDGKPDFNAATPLNPTPGQAVSGIDAHLATGVAVSGAVRGDTGPLAGINVFINPYDGPGPSTGAQTDADGNYRTGALPDGDYRVQFDDPTDVFANQYWNGHAGWNDADRLHLQVASGTERTGIDATLAEAATITGTVTDDAGPVADICVNANTPAANGGWSGVGGTRTQAGGTYILTGLPPSVDLRIQFQDCAVTPSHVEQWWDGRADFDRSTPLNLTPGQAKSGIDAHLATGIRIAGTVTDTAGSPLANIDVNVNPDGQGPGGYGRTAVDGHYVTSPVAPGTYRVQFRDNAGAWASLYWNQQPTYGTATLLVLGAADGPQHNGIDARLALAASISGTVSNARNQPVGGICVDGAIDTPNGPDGVGQVRTDGDGNYTLAGLPAVPVKVRARDCDLVGPYSTLWWPAAATFDAATPIDLTPGEHQQDVDFELQDAATISGTVRASSGNGLGGICVQAVTADEFGALTQTAGDGTYRMLLSEPGDYVIQFVDCTSRVYAGWTRPGTISIGPGDEIAGVNATLVPGATATVSGSIRNGDGLAVTGACAVVYLANQYAVFGPVAADGTFTVSGVPSGTFAVAFIGCEGGQPSAIVHDPVDPARTYQARWWHDVAFSLAGTSEGGPDPIARGATLVAVPAGGELTGFDQCFGCAPPPTTTTTSTTTSTTTTTTGTTTITTPATTTTAPTQLAITITGHTRGPSTITLTFTVTGVLAASDAAGETVTYTATCTSSSGAVVRAPGQASPLVVSGVDDRARYACVVVATEGGRFLGTSGVVVIDPISGGTLPATGARTSGTTWTAVVTTLLGGLLLLAVRRPRRAGH